MVGCVEGILGIRPAPEGILIKPAIPAEWDGFTMEKTFRGKKIRVRVDNSAHKQGDPARYILNGQERPAELIPEMDLRAENDLVIVM